MSPTTPTASDAPFTLPRGQNPAALIGAFTAAAIIAQQVAAKSARDALFLTTFGSRSLPGAMLVATVVSLIGVLGFSRALTRWSPARVVPAAFGLNALIIGAVWAASASLPRLAAIAIYFHISMFGATLISGFWSLVNERFDPHSAKRQVGKIVAGSTIGGIVGGVLTWRWARSADVPSLFAMVAGVNVVCALGALLLRQGIVAEPAESLEVAAPAEAVSALGMLKSVPYLRHLALVVMLGGLTDAVFEYLLNAQAALSFVDPRRLVSFFAIFQTATGLVSVLVQWKLTRPALRRLGLAGSVALLPVASLGGGMLAALLPRLSSVTLMRAAEGVMKTSLFRAAYELLYTPLVPARKRATKALIDVGFDRVGTAVGSGLTMLALFVVPNNDIRLLLAIGAAAALASVLISRRLHSGYVSALEDGLRSGHAQVEQSEWSGSPWMPPEGPWQARKAVKLVEHGAPPPRPLPLASPPSPSSRARTSNAAVMRAIADLRSGSAKRIRRVLRDGIDRDLILAAHLMPLLARDDLVKEVAERLKPIAARISGQLADALLDAGADVKLRYRVAKLLALGSSPFAVAALVQALDDASFAVRHQAALSLLRLSELDPKIRFDTELILGFARREIERGRASWGKETLFDAGDEEDPIFGELRERANRSLAQVIAVLSLVLEREPLWIAYQALHTDVDQLRGTAIEYLENILPEDIRTSLWPLLGVLQPTASERRTHRRIADDLLGAKQSVLDHLRRLTGAVAP
jgi:AAA family ATP:ADP antiporter